MSLPVKAGLGVLAAGSVAGVSYAGVSYFGKENKVEKQGKAIEDLINKEYEYTLLNTSEGADNKDGTYWDTNWQTYKDDNTDQDKDIFNLDGWNKSNPGNSPLALKKKCGQLATEKVAEKTENLYQKVTKYCARSITVEDQARRKNLTILKTDSPSSDAEIWKSRHTNAATLKNSLDLLEITGSKVTEEGIRTGCSTAKSKNKKESAGKYQEIYDAYVKVCTKQSTDPTV